MRVRRNFCRAFLLLFVFQFSFLPGRDAIAQLVGATQGTFDVTTSGMATYSIPIVVPPGTHQIQPGLGLTYASSPNNGPLGVGWHLGGLPAITRCASTLSQDGVLRPIAYTLNDRLCLEGERLVLRTGVYGRLGSQYRTEHDQNVRVRAWGSGPGNFATYFEVATLGGQTLIFGGTTDSIIEAVGTSVPRTYALSSVSDLNGNTMRISYTENTATGEYQPAAITYTENALASPPLAAFARVEFQYDTTLRPDRFVAYVGGAQVSATARMKGIVACTITPAQPTCTTGTISHEYRFTYQIGTDDGLSRLTTLTECGKNGQCLPATAFTWATDATGWTASTAFQLPGYVAALEKVQADMVDLNADGYVDYVYAFDGVSSPPTRDVHLNGPNGFAAGQATGWASLPILFQSANNESRSRRLGLLADLNGDGYPESVTASTQGSTDTRHTYMNTKTGFATAENLSYRLPDDLFMYSSTTTRQVGTLVDLNGDGLPDYVKAFTGFNNTPNLLTELNTGTGWGPAQPATGGLQLPEVMWTYISNNGEVPRQTAVLVDLNGDGLPEFVRSYSTPSGTFNQTWINDGVTFTPVPAGGGLNLPGALVTIPVGKGSRRIADLVDVNGDGLPDYVGSYIGTGGNSHFETWLNTGTGFVRNTAWDTPVAVYDYTGDNVRQRAALSDINGDGLIDILVSYSGVNGATLIDTYLNSPTGFSHTAAATSYETPDRIWAYPDASSNRTTALLIDIDGDGDLDFVRGYNGASNNYLDTRLNNTTTVPRITRIADGFGKTIDVTYTPGTRPTVYTKGASAVYPTLDLVTSAPFVSRYQISDGIGGTRGVTRTYGGLQIDMFRRAPLGFAQVTSLDELKNLKTTQNFLRPFPQEGRLSSSELRDMTTNRLLETVSNVWTVSPTFPSALKYYQNLMTSSIVGKYELNDTSGQPVFIVTTARTFDSNGIPTSEDLTTSDGFRKVTTTTYSIDAADQTVWLLALPVQIEVRAADVTVGPFPAPGTGRIMQRSFTPGTGRLQSETTEPGGPASLNLTTTMGYDVFGNATSSTTTSASLPSSRVTTSIYDATGRFILSSANALNHTIVRGFDSATGNVTSEQGPNLNVPAATFQFDALGRPSGSVSPSGVTRTLTLATSDAKCPSLTRSAVTATTTGAPTEVTCADMMGRTVRTVKAGFTAGTQIYQDIVYDAASRASKTSRPYFSTDTTLAWDTTGYDAIDRAITHRQAGQSVDSTVYYFGQWLRVTNEKGQETTQYYNSRGNMVDVQDANHTFNMYEYDGFGNVTSLNTGGGSTFITYDKLGRQTRVNDPDTGITTQAYDALGEVLTKTDARGVITTFTYDKIGRLTQSVASDRTATFTYDTATNGVGQPATETGTAASFQRTYSFDAFGRPGTVATSIAGTSYAFSNTYDSGGRVATVTYPGGYQLTNLYNAQGYLSEIQNAGATIWKTELMSADGQVQREKLGANLTTERAFDPNSGRLLWLTTTSTGGTSIQNMNYSWDVLGNLLSRSDSVVGKSETFAYEPLNRLTGVTLGATSTMSMTYDITGNITSKTGVGNYTYPAAGSPRPHAVQSTSVGSKSYGYDGAGNMTNYAGQATLSYNSINKPTAVSQASPARTGTYDYGPKGELIRRVEAAADQGITSQSWVLVGDLYEVFTRNGVVEKRNYITAAGRQVAVWTERPAGTSDLRFLHSDHIGSTNVVTDASNVLERQSYDAFGVRRNATTWGPPPAGGVASTVTPGFTGHQQFDIFALIYMRARMYDPVLGRFMNPDTVVDSLGSTQAFNRYSYVNNNPLSMVDPDGHIPKWLQRAGKVAGTIGLILVGGPHAYFSADYLLSGGDLNTALKMYALQTVTIGIAVAAAYLAWWALPETAGFWVTLLVNVLTSAASSAATAAINGEDVGHAALLGAVIAAGVTVLGAAASYMTAAMTKQSPTLDQMKANWKAQGWTQDKIDSELTMMRDTGALKAGPNGTEILVNDLEGVRPGAGENGTGLLDYVFGNGTFGGNQYGQHTLFGFEYARGSWIDKFIHYFAGPHDYLNSFYFYDAQGFNNISGSFLGVKLGDIGQFVITQASPIINVAHLAPAAAFAVSSIPGAAPVIATVATRERF